jgi:hypothetical protein
MKKGPPKDQFRIFVLTVQLQEYINKPHEMPLWTTNTDGLILHNTILQDNGEYHKVYIPSSNPLTQKTRSGQRFNSKMVVDGRSEFQRYASVTPLQQAQVLLHSAVPIVGRICSSARICPCFHVSVDRVHPAESVSLSNSFLLL